MPRVSTIIPVYNAEAYIAHAVQTALNQVGVDNEVIVVDDGSTDGTGQILERFGGAIRALRQSNAGHVRARNAGAKLATGEWLAFLDADDDWMPDKLAKQLAVADADTAMVYTDRNNFGDISHVSELQSDSVSLWEGKVFEKLLLGNFVTVSSVIMRKTWFDQLGGFDPELLVCEDWDMWLRCTALGGNVRLCREPLTRYRWHVGSMSNNLDRMCSGRLQVVRRALSLDKGKEAGKALVRRALASAWECSAFFAAPTNRLKALNWYFRSLCCWPFKPLVYKEMLRCLIGVSR